ncbi:hypothetical protein BH10PSE19_BH10PSE19_09980 [soil metagenome]
MKKVTLELSKSGTEITLMGAEEEKKDDAFKYVWDKLVKATPKISYMHKGKGTFWAKFDISFADALGMAATSILTEENTSGNGTSIAALDFFKNAAAIYSYHYGGSKKLTYILPEAKAEAPVPAKH